MRVCKVCDVRYPQPVYQRHKISKHTLTVNVLAAASSIIGRFLWFWCVLQPFLTHAISHDVLVCCSTASNVVHLRCRLVVMYLVVAVCDFYRRAETARRLTKLIAHRKGDPKHRYVMV